MDAMGARRQAGQVEIHQNAAIDGGEGRLFPARLAVQVLQMGDGARLATRVHRRGTVSAASARKSRVMATV